MLLEMMIAQICVGTAGSEREACTKAVEATAIQYSIARDVKNAESKAGDAIERELAEVTGDKVLAITLYTAKVIRDREVSANVIRERGRMPSTNLTATKNSGRVTFSWSF